MGLSSICYPIELLDYDNKYALDIKIFISVAQAITFAFISFMFAKYFSNKLIDSLEGKVYKVSIEEFQTSSGIIFALLFSV